MKSTETSTTTAPTYKNPLFEMLWFYLSFRHSWTEEQTLIQQEHLRRFTLLHPEWMNEIDDEFGQTPLAMAVVNDIPWAVKTFLKSDACDKNPTLFYGTIDEEKPDNTETASEPKVIERKLIPCLLSEGNEISPVMKDLLWSTLVPGRPNQPLERLLFAMEQGYHGEVDQMLETHQDVRSIKAIGTWIKSMAENGRTKKEEYPFIRFVENILKQSTEHKTINPEAVDMIEHVPAETHPALLAYAFTHPETRLCLVHDNNIDNYVGGILEYALKHQSIALLDVVLIFHKELQSRKENPSKIDVIQYVKDALKMDVTEVAIYLLEHQENYCTKTPYRWDLNEPLLHAVKQQDMALLRAIVMSHKKQQQGKEKPDTLDIKETIHYAIDKELTEVATYLIEQKESSYLNYWSCDSTKYLRKAQEKGMNTVFLGLLSTYTYLDTYHFLKYALKHENVDQIKALLKYKSDFFYSDGISANAFHFLIQKNEESYILRKIEELRNDIWFSQCVYVATFRIACKYGNIPIITALLPHLKNYVQKEKDVHIERKLWENIQTAIENQKIDVVDFLLALPELQTYRVGSIAMSGKVSKPKEHQVESALLAAVRCPNDGLALTKKILASPFMPAIRTHFLCEFYHMTPSAEIKILLLHQICQRMDAHASFFGSEYEKKGDEIKQVIDFYPASHQAAHAWIVGKECCRKLLYSRKEDRDPAFVLDVLRNNAYVAHIPHSQTLDIMRYAAENGDREVVDVLLAHTCWQKLPVGNDGYGWMDCLRAGIKMQHATLVHHIIHIKKPKSYLALDSNLCEACCFGNEAIVRSILTSEKGRKIEAFWINAAKEAAVKAGHPELVPVITSCLSWSTYLNQPRAEPAVQQAEQGWCMMM